MGEIESAPAPDPIIQTRIEYRAICPAELLLDLPAMPAPAADAIVEGNDAGFDWLRAVTARSLLLERRLADAKAEC